MDYTHCLNRWNTVEDTQQTHWTCRGLICIMQDCIINQQTNITMQLEKIEIFKTFLLKEDNLKTQEIIFASLTVCVKKMIGRHNSDSYRDLILSYAVPHILTNLAIIVYYRKIQLNSHIIKKRFYNIKYINLNAWRMRGKWWVMYIMVFHLII